MHEQVRDWIAARVDDRPVRVLEIGSLDINGGIRDLFAPAERYHGIDLAAGPGVDEVADAASWRSDERFDVVVCAEVLEHTPAWEAVTRTAWEALRPGGRLLLTCATDPRAPHSAIDGLEPRADEHYANVDPAELATCLRSWGCEEWTVELHRDRGDLYVDARRPS